MSEKTMQIRNSTKEIAIFKTDKETINVEVIFEEDTVWLTQDQTCSETLCGCATTSKPPPNIMNIVIFNIHENA